MPKIIKGDNGLISVRLDGAYVIGGKHLIEAYIDGEDRSRFFGNFKFKDTQAVKTLLKQAVRESGLEDTVFEGAYPKWIEDSYGESLQVQNKVKFYKTLRSEETLEKDEINDYIYALEVHLKKSKDDGIFLVVPRAIAIENNSTQLQDSLFEAAPFNSSLSLTDEDLPF